MSRASLEVSHNEERGALFLANLQVHYRNGHFVMLLASSNYGSSAIAASEATYGPPTVKHESGSKSQLIYRLQGHSLRLKYGEFSTFGISKFNIFTNVRMKIRDEVKFD